MGRDTQSKAAANKERIRRSKRLEELNKKKKRSGNFDNSTDEDESYDENETDSENEEIDIHEYRKYISQIFPSKHMNEKIKAGERLKKVINEKNKEQVKTSKKNKKIKRIELSEDEEENWETSSENEEEETSKNIKNNSDEDDEDEDDEDYEDNGSEQEDLTDETDYDEESTGEIKDVKTPKKYGLQSPGKGSKLNIIFTIGGKAKDEDYDDDDDDSDTDCGVSEDDTENEDEEVSSDESEEESDEKKSKKSNKKNTDKKESDEKNKTTTDTTDETINTETLTHLKTLLQANPTDKSIKKCIEVYEQDLKKQKTRQENKSKKQQAKNLRIFRKILKDKNTMNDFNFYEKLDTEQQKKIIKELREINKITRIEKPYRMTLLESNIPVEFKSAAMKKINSLRYMEPGSGEFYKSKNWVDAFMRIPFNKYEGLPISISDGVDKCHEFMENAQKTLDQAVYGLNDAKMQIMQMIGQLLTNPSAIGTAIAIHGPPGTGKCMVLDTPILMYDGTIKMVQDIEVGDIIMGDNSTPRNVLSLGRGEDNLYEIIPTKGEKYGVNSEHILCLKPSGLNRIKQKTNKNGSTSYKASYLNKHTYKLESKNFDNLKNAEKFIEEKTNENDIVEISVKNLISLPNYVKQHLKGYRVGVDFEFKELPFDPYIIGVWLGDGTSSKPEITNQDSTILHYVRDEIKKYNLNLNYYSDYTYRIAYDMHDNDSRNNKNVFLQVLKDQNLLNNKHIPKLYKINDKNNRLQLLAGLIDTDGSYSNKDKCFDIIQKNKILSDDILFLARSLGYAAYQKKCTKSCLYKGNKVEGIYYRICISGDNLSEIPTKCIRKQAGDREQNKDVLKTGISVNHIGWGKYYGFTLDDNHRYLLGDFTVTHNTSLVKEGISKILNRPFAFIALGGATDSSFLEGHGYTYEGSTWGKIVQILIESKCMNPVIYFDELDKISETPRGEEIAGILTHLTDTTQNSQFHDKYFTEINFDLSKCLFIFSYNDERKVNPILKDRMYRIKTKGYVSKEKTIITNNYLLPKIREQVRFNEGEITIPNDVIGHIIDNHCNKEDGVRNLKRCLEIIYTKLNLYRLMKPGSNLFEGEMALKVEFPFNVTKEIVDKLIKRETDGLETWRSLYL